MVYQRCQTHPELFMDPELDRRTKNATSTSTERINLCCGTNTLPVLFIPLLFKAKDRRDQLVPRPRFDSTLEVWREMFGSGATLEMGAGAWRCHLHNDDERRHGRGTRQAGGNDTRRPGYAAR